MVKLGGGQARKTISDANGNYRFENVDTGGFYTVTPSRQNFSFNPATAQQRTIEQQQAQLKLQQGLMVALKQMVCRNNRNAEIRK